jgi:hypothetical protein
VNAERIAGVGVFAVVVAGIAIGFATIGSPQHMRAIELDHRRVSDLQSIERMVHRADSRRPAGTATAPPRRRDDWPRDPQTGEPYGYARLSPTHYVLCAAFALPSDADGAASDTAWPHRAGRTCYRLDVSLENDRPEIVLRTVPVL